MVADRHGRTGQGSPHRSVMSAQPIRWCGPSGMSGRRVCRAQGQAVVPERWVGGFAGLWRVFVCSGCRITRPCHHGKSAEFQGLAGVCMGLCHTPAV